VDQRAAQRAAIETHGHHVGEAREHTALERVVGIGALA